MIPCTVVLGRQHYSNPLDMDVLWPCSFHAQDLARAARVDTAVVIRTSDELNNTSSALFLLFAFHPDYVLRSRSMKVLLYTDGNVKTLHGKYILSNLPFHFRSQTRIRVQIPGWNAGRACFRTWILMPATIID